MGDPITQARLEAMRQADRTPVTVNGWWRDWAGGYPAWWDYYTTGGGAIARDQTTGNWESCGGSLKLSGGTAEVYQDLWGLLQEGWRGLDVTILVRSYRVTNNYEVVVDYGAGGASAVLQGDATDAWEDRAITLTVPAGADQLLLVLRWTNATGEVLFDRVQVSVGSAQVGWLGEQLEPVMLCEGVRDDAGGSFLQLPDPRMVLIATEHTGLTGTSDADEEDWATAADYWPSGWAKIDAGTAGDRVTVMPCYAVDDGNNNVRKLAAAVGEHAQLDGKPTTTVSVGVGVTFSSDDLACTSLVFLHQQGPDPATRVAYPGGV